MSRVDKTDDEGFVDNSEGGRPIYDAKHGEKSLNKKRRWRHIHPQLRRFT